MLAWPSRPEEVSKLIKGKLLSSRLAVRPVALVAHYYNSIILKLLWKASISGLAKISKR